MTTIFDRVVGALSGSGQHRYYRRGLWETSLAIKYQKDRPYYNLCALSQAKHAVETSVAISAMPGVEFGCQEKTLKRHLGRPSAIVTPRNFLHDRIYLYRHLISGLKVKTEYHFNEDGLFYYNHTFRDITVDYQRLIIELIRKKYLDTRPFDHLRDKIVDEHGCELIVNQNISISIDYIWIGGATCQGLMRDCEPEDDHSISLEEQCRALSAHL
jgi:hypothetical protein